LARVSLFLIMLALIAGMSGFYVIVGDDTPPSQNLEIRTWYDLNAVRDNMSGNHILMDDLDSTTPGYTELASPTANQGKGWEPIGYSTPVASCGGAYMSTYGLSGTFDGQGHEIRDLFINCPDEFAVGLFAYLMKGGIIKNVGVVNITVVGHNVVGSLLGYNEGGTVYNCYSTGNVTGHAAIGGLVGRLYDGNIINSYSTGSVTGESSTGIGGLVGQQHSEGTISNCYCSCSVAGGLEFGSGDIGGLVGENYGGPVSSSFWDTETSGQSTSDGGRGKNTTEMQDITTFSVAGWNIIAVALNEANPAYIWNIVNGLTYPFLSWQP
jgi:hypothetical protein